MSVNVSLTPHLEAFVQRQIASGRFDSADEVVLAALMVLEEHEQADRNTRNWLKGKIEEGLAGGPGNPLTGEFWEGLRRRLRERDSGSGRDA